MPMLNIRLLLYFPFLPGHICPYESHCSLLEELAQSHWPTIWRMKPIVRKIKPNHILLNFVLSYSSYSGDI